jgi:pimeloyl-ACP methyl ester carboxylesterase
MGQHTIPPAWRNATPSRRRTVLVAVMALVSGVLAATGQAKPVPGGPEGGPPLNPSRSASLQGHFYNWRGSPSDVEGGSQYSQGEIIVTDRPFADHGAQTDPASKDPTDYPNGSTECGLPLPCYGQGGNAKDGYLPSEYGGAGTDGGAVGSYRYPAGGKYANDAADIVETRVAVGQHAWYLLVRLGTLKAPALSAIEARIDWRHTLLVHGQQGTFDGRPVSVVSGRTRAFFEVRIPFSVYNPGTRVHRVFLAAGLWKPDANRWYYPASAQQIALANAQGSKPGEGPSTESPFFDLAYVPDEGMDSYWRDARQAADIASKNFGKDAFPVDFGALEHRGCPARGCYQGPRRGLFARVFRSGQPLGRGVVLQKRYGQDSGTYTRNDYLSPDQPYAIYVPKHPTGGLVLLIHHLGGSYMSYPMTSMPGLADWAERLGVIVAMPEARGEGGWYQGEAEKDVFEVWRDVARHYHVDRNRVYLAGMSMGGYGTWRLAQLYPDLFARAIVWSGLMTPSGGSLNLEDLFGNTGDLPLLVVHGVADPLVPVTGPEQWMPHYAAVGHGTYRYLLYLDRSHETTYPGSTEPWVLDWLKGLPPRVSNPVRVTYRIERSFFQPRFGITYSHAYWAQGLVLAPGSRAGSIDASRSGAMATTRILPRTYGADRLGPYRLEGQNVTPPKARRNLVNVKLSGLSHAALDTVRMGWSRAQPQRVTGVTDRAATLVLRGDYRGKVLVTGVSRWQASVRSLALNLPPGRFDLTVTARPS